MMAEFPVAIAEAARALVEKLPLSLLQQLDELAGDRIRLRRLRRLVRILEEAQRIAEAKGISPNNMRVLADHVGLPWMENASLRDDEDLRRAWAHLFVTITTEENEEIHSTCVRILGEMNPWDCRVLDHMVRNAVVLPSEDSEGYTPIPVHDEDVLTALGTEPEGRSRTRIFHRESRSARLSWQEHPCANRGRRACLRYAARGFDGDRDRGQPILRIDRAGVALGRACSK